MPPDDFEADWRARLQAMADAGDEGAVFALARRLTERTWEAVADKLAEGLRLTREYVGEDTLPNYPGWSHFDALQCYRRAKGMPEEREALRYTHPWPVKHEANLHVCPECFAVVEGKDFGEHAAWHRRQREQ